MTATPQRQAAPESSVRRLAVAFLLVGALAAGIVGVERTTRPSRFVDHLEIVNPSATLVDVHLRGDAPGILHLTTVEPRSTQITRDVLDQGRDWVFEFVVVGTTAGELRTDRRALERSGWRVTIPDEVLAVIEST